MNAELVSKKDNKAEFTMDFTAEEFDAALDRAFKENRDRFVVDGFRRGKAPRSIIEKRYGEGVFFESALDILLSDAYPAALSELDLEPVGSPTLDFKEGTTLGKGKPVNAIVTVYVAPEPEVKDYKGIQAERHVKKVTDEDVQKQLEAVQKQNARLVNTEEPAESGDTVVLDYKGFVGEEQFEGGTAENYSLKLGSGQFIPGFEDQLIGVKAGEDREVCVTFPEQYHSKDLAGKEAVFKCSVHEVKKEELPEINDDFAVDVSVHDTLEEYKADIRKMLEEAAEGAAEYDGKNNIMEKLVAANDFDIPQVMVDNEVQNMLSEYEQQLSQNGISLEMYASFMGKDVEGLKEDLKGDAVNRIKSRLLTKAVAKAENLEASEEEIQKEFEDMAKQYGMEADALRKVIAADSIKEDIVMRKALDFLYANAVFTDIEEGSEAAPEKTDEQ
ncbi:MAG: trigger factor [Firmicutes bacterium]|nr:trigger factor [Bacillota bacterium]